MNIKNLQQELLELAQKWNSGEYDDTEFEGRLFLSDDDFDFLAKKTDCFMSADDAIDQNKFERLFNCRVIWEYNGVNPNRQWGDCEIIFNQISDSRKYKVTNQFDGYSLSDLVRMYDEYQGGEGAWSDLSTTDIPATCYEMIRVILVDLDSNGTGHNIITVNDFVERFSNK